MQSWSHTALGARLSSRWRIDLDVVDGMVGFDEFNFGGGGQHVDDDCRSASSLFREAGRLVG